MLIIMFAMGIIQVKSKLIGLDSSRTENEPNSEEDVDLKLSNAKLANIAYRRIGLLGVIDDVNMTVFVLSFFLSL